jgi:hypothetical protein
MRAEDLVDLVGGESFVWAGGTLKATPERSLHVLLAMYRITMLMIHPGASLDAPATRAVNAPTPAPTDGSLGAE